jgi:hypothetical protein
MSNDIFEQQVVRTSRLAGQLYADLKSLGLDNEQQAMQIILDYFEKVGEVAVQTDREPTPVDPEYYNDQLIGSGGLNSCRCNEYETCAVCTSVAFPKDIKTARI